MVGCRNEKAVLCKRPREEDRKISHILAKYCTSQKQGWLIANKSLNVNGEKIINLNAGGREMGDK